MAARVVLLVCTLCVLLSSARATIAIHDFTVDLSSIGQTFDTMQDEYNISAFRLHLLPDRDDQYDWKKIHNYDPNMTVGLHILVPPEMRLLFTSMSMRIACGDYVAISEGELAPQPFKQLLKKGCGDSTQEAVTTSGRDAYIRFHSNGDDVGVKFSLIVTPFSLGPCDEFYCNNGRCIDSSLSCNFNDNCGDNSNNDGCMSSYPENNLGVKLLFGIILLFSGLIVVSIAVCCCCQKTKGQRGSVITTSGQVKPMAVYQHPTFLLGPENYWNRVPNQGSISFNIPPQKSQIVYAVGLNMYGDSAMKTAPEKPPID